MNRSGDRESPCLVLIVVENQSPIRAPIRTADFELSYNI